ncbi:hypothetical protein Z950_2692 [Sulfitobacter mediterraneus KCTC 32188]|nr:hypothetical protein Z950_2692 [Sulfitobacter mediterraneus KCTC 32188]
MKVKELQTAYVCFDTYSGHLCSAQHRSNWALTRHSPRAA